MKLLIVISYNLLSNDDRKLFPLNVYIENIDNQSLLQDKKIDGIMIFLKKFKELITKQLN